VFTFLLKFCPAVPSFKGAVVLPWSRTNFDKHLNRHILQFAGIKLTENVNEVNLILVLESMHSGRSLPKYLIFAWQSSCGDREQRITTIIPA